jgi:hypothetical protein
LQRSVDALDRRSLGWGVRGHVESESTKIFGIVGEDVDELAGYLKP